MRSRQNAAAANRIGEPFPLTAGPHAPVPVSADPTAALGPVTGSPLQQAREAQRRQRVHGNHRVREAAARPLPEEVRGSMEGLLGADLTEVTVREGDEPDAIDAIAYTAGTEIVFARGEYDPGSLEGRRVLAHELRHVLQQRDGRVPATSQVVDDPDLEREAEQAGEAAVSGTDLAMIGPLSAELLAPVSTAALQPMYRPDRSDQKSNGEEPPKHPTAATQGGEPSVVFPELTPEPTYVDIQELLERIGHRTADSTDQDRLSRGFPPDHYFDVSELIERIGSVPGAASRSYLEQAANELGEELLLAQIPEEIVSNILRSFREELDAGEGKLTKTDVGHRMLEILQTYRD
jgi:hypothetical protein